MKIENLLFDILRILRWLCVSGYVSVIYGLGYVGVVYLCDVILGYVGRNLSLFLVGLMFRRVGLVLSLRRGRVVELEDGIFPTTTTVSSS